MSIINVLAPCIKYQKETLQDNFVNIGPFRFIKPYEFTFEGNTKKRWIGRKLLDVFKTEFKHWEEETIKERIQKGQILINGNHIPVDYTFKDGDRLKHSMIRREAPIYNTPIVKIGETVDYVAYLKPSSMPVNPSGGYFYNSLIKQVGPSLFPVHRLDIVTSGIIVFAKTQSAARVFMEMLDSGVINKSYIARVRGQFSPGETIVDEPIDTDRTLNRMVVIKSGKPSKTVFRLISTNGSESIVECNPITGRTHQIRVHLSYLGFPISNDSMYGGVKEPWNKAELKALNRAEQLGLWPSDVIIDKENPELDMMVYLHSFHYKSSTFDFKAPLPDWADLEVHNSCHI